MESFSLLINSSCTKHIKPLLATASKPITRSCNNCVRVMIRLLYTMSDFLNQKGPWLSGPIPVFNNQGDWGPWPWTNDSSWGGDEKPGHSAEWGIPWFSNAASHPNTIFAQSSQCGGCIGPLQSMDVFSWCLSVETLQFPWNGIHLCRETAFSGRTRSLGVTSLPFS